MNNHVGELVWYVHNPQFTLGGRIINIKTVSLEGDADIIDVEVIGYVEDKFFNQIILNVSKGYNTGQWIQIPKLVDGGWF